MQKPCTTKLHFGNTECRSQRNRRCNMRRPHNVPSHDQRRLLAIYNEAMPAVHLGTSKRPQLVLPNIVWIKLFHSHYNVAIKLFHPTQTFWKFYWNFPSGSPSDCLNCLPNIVKCNVWCVMCKVNYVLNCNNYKLRQFGHGPYLRVQTAGCKKQVKQIKKSNQAHNNLK